MATEPQINELRATVDNLGKLNEEKLIRRTLGEESLEKEIVPLLAELRNKTEFALKYAGNVNGTYVEHIRTTLEQIIAQCEAQANRNNQEFIAEKGAFLSKTQNMLETLKLHWSSFITAAVEESGLLADKGIKQAYDSTLEEMRVQSDEALEKLKIASTEAIEEAKTLAAGIETRARKTAAKISVEEAQTQFKEAQTPLVIQLVVWGALSLIAYSSFFILLWKFLGPEQRDFIYAQLVESITQFGDTGLVEGGEGESSATKLTIENIMS